jgi:PAT family acetyl-CoA transporter-like MFS transporter 1
VLYTVQIAILGVIETIVGTMPFIALSAFFLRICDKSIGGTYLTFLNSFTNLGNLWCSLLISVLSRHFSLSTFILISCFYNIGILVAWRKKVFEL